MAEPQASEENSGADQSTVGASAVANDHYEVGRGRPPKQYQWKKGQSGNPSGRPRKGRSKKAILERIMNERVTIRQEGKELKVTKFDALIRSLISKAVKGDARSAKLFMDEVTRVGLGEEQEGDTPPLLPPKNQLAQSDELFANLNLDLLSDEDKAELARAGQIIDLGGDFTALSPRDFERIKAIADKGRGKDVTSRA